MDSYDWQILSHIFLGIGIVLFIAALILTIRYRVISNLISDIKVRKMSPEPLKAASTINLSLRSTDPELSAPPESDEDGPWTVVVAPVQDEENIDSTVVVGNNKNSESDFIITSNIVVINADVDVIDNGRRK
ncbi:hypothetical protein [Ruminococcus sp.]|uniref:hypothetical protein n=1 Tax=Ruminococcus sp. TaxID=41978 RepID=UPI001B557CF3|nr:hypothetical protein [Ruminococcus sp.]MBP5580665.1 hypothetical protein [Ruminococcus sp.]MCR4638319.1 hypothetical protein [Ruminococcus sp.]